MSLPQASTDYYRNQQRITTAVLANSRRLWRTIGGDFEAGWLRLRPQLTVLTIAGQIAVASDADPYLRAVLAETGQPDTPTARINPRGFAGTAPDGRPLDSLLYGAIVSTKTAIGRGLSTPDALAAGGRWLDMTIQTTLADAGRSSVGVGIAASPEITGYVRMLNPPSCSRCVVLAGRFYRWNSGFARHPGCDCRHIPASENIAEDLTTDPLSYFNSLTSAQQDATFTRAGAEAIRDGSNLAQVVNARRGVYTTADGITATTEGTSRRTRAGRNAAARRGGGVRLMPEQIYASTATRDEAIELLRRHGYLV